MLFHHFSGGMGVETLRFEDVHEDHCPPGPEYVDIQQDKLPELRGTNFWWEVLPLSGESVR